MTRQHDNSDRPGAGHGSGLSMQRISRRTALALGAAGAGLAAMNPMALARARAMSPTGSAAALSGSLAVLLGTYAPSPTFKQPGKLYSSYQKLHPGVSFTYPKGPTASDEASQVAWLTTRGLANRLPDIYSAANAIFVDTIRDGWWVDLTPYLDKPNPYIPGNKRWRDSIKAGLLDQGAYFDGRNYAFEADGANQAFFINKDIFRKVGVTAPTTWAELMDISHKFKKAGFYAFGMPNGQAWTVHNLSQVMESLMWSSEFKKPESTYILSAIDLVRVIKSGGYNRTDPRNVEAWKLLKDWFPTWYPGSLTAQDYRPFVKGNIAIWFDGTWNIAALQAAMGSKLDIIAQPPVTSATSKYGNGDTSMGSGDFSAGNPIVVSATAQREGRLDLAVNFLQYFSSPKIIGPLTLEQGLVPMVKGAETPGPLEQKAIKWFISRPCLFGAASDQLGAKLYGAHQNLCTGYLAGSVDLTSALRQLQSVQVQVVDNIIARDHLKI